MSHSLHRKGNHESLSNDFILIALLNKSTSKSLWQEQCEKLKKLSEICLRHKPDNYGKSAAVFHAVYTDIDLVEKVLEELKRADLGISVVITGIRDHVIAVGKKLSLPLNAVHLSLGVFGNKARLSDEKILEVTTMCGHHCISPFLVKKIISSLRSDQINMQDAISELSSLCSCGIFNRQRAQELLDEIVSAENPA